MHKQTKGKGIVLKVEVHNSDSVPYTEEHIMMLTRNFGKIFRKSCITSRPQNYTEMAIETGGIPISKGLAEMFKEKVMNQHRKGKASCTESVEDFDTYRLCVPTG